MNSIIIPNNETFLFILKSVANQSVRLTYPQKVPGMYFGIKDKENPIKAGNVGRETLNILITFIQINICIEMAMMIIENEKKIFLMFS